MRQAERQMERMERQSEETVQRRPAGIDGSNARRCQDDILLPGILGNIAQECGLSRSRLSSEKERAARIVHNLQGVLPLLIV